VELTVTGQLQFRQQHVFFNDDLELAIAIAMRDLTLEKLAERFAAVTARQRQNIEARREQTVK